MNKYIELNSAKLKILWFLSACTKGMEDSVIDDLTKRIDAVFGLFDIIEPESVQELKHGRWKQICTLSSWQFTNEHFECSVCKSKEENRRKYCPNCGAIMDLEDDK